MNLLLIISSLSGSGGGMFSQYIFPICQSQYMWLHLKYVCFIVLTMYLSFTSYSTILSNDFHFHIVLFIVLFFFPTPLSLFAHPCFESIHYSFCLFWGQLISLHLSISLFVLPLCTVYTTVGLFHFHSCCSSQADCHVCHTSAYCRQFSGSKKHSFGWIKPQLMESSDCKHQRTEAHWKKTNVGAIIFFLFFSCMLLRYNLEMKE